MKFPIYMDNNATTRTDPRVVEAMLPYFTEIFGNAASNSHSFGWAAEEAVAKGRYQVAQMIDAASKEIIFTSGATESNNLALKGAAKLYEQKGDHIITVVTEHKAILDTAKHLESEGKRVTYLGVDQYGLIDLNELENSITDKTILVSVMFANNEIGTIAPIAEIGAICRRHNVLFHTDATQGTGKCPINVDAMQIDLLSISAHKMHGPKGVGALYVRAKNPRVRLAPQIDGGGHENGMRSGTLNVTGIVGLGEAAEICLTDMAQDSAHCTHLRDRLRDTILSNIPCSKLNGHPTQRLPHNLSIAFEGLEAEALLVELKEIALSSGSACSSNSIDSSHVLRSLPEGESIARSTLRFGLSRFSTLEEVDYVADRVAEAVAKQRKAIR